MYNRSGLYNGKHKYMVVEGTIDNHKIIADGFTSMKSVKDFYRDYKIEHGKDSTKKFLTMVYK